MAKDKIEYAPIAANQYGKLPPQATELEEIVLGAIMIEKSAYDLVSEFLKAKCFYKVAHQKIYEAITTLATLQEPIDMHTVTDQLRKNGTIDDVGGPYFITLLTASVSSASHLEYHAQIIYQKYVGREMIRIASQISEMAYSDQTDIAETIAFANKSINDVSNFSGSSILSMGDSIELMIKNIEYNSSDKKTSSGSLTGFVEFDKRSGGLQKSDLILIAAETSQGKTSLALSITNNISKNGGKVAIYSMEMRAIQIAARFTAFETGIPANDILYGKFDAMKFEQLDKNIGRLASSEIYIDENSTSNLDSILSSIRSMVKNYNLDGVVIDYIQLINVSGGGMNKEQQTALIARSLKNIAKDLNIWVIALSQLSRDGQNPLPTIKRLRDSGQLEEAADICMLIYRPEQAGRKEFPEPFENIGVEGMGMIDVAKGRNIGTFKFLSKFDKPTTHFYERTDFNYQGADLDKRERDFTEHPF